MRGEPLRKAVVKAAFFCSFLIYITFFEIMEDICKKHSKKSIIWHGFLLQNDALALIMNKNRVSMQNWVSYVMPVACLKGEMPLRSRTLMTVCLAVTLLLSTVVCAAAADTATLTIKPDRTEITSDGGATKITYTVTVTPPAGKEIGVFSFRLRPSGQMQLPQSFTENGEKVITYADNGLEYNVTDGTGVFRTYEYTPESAFFAAVGTTEGHRMTKEAEIITITATVPAGVTGAFMIDADFTVAPDGSGNSYTPLVQCDPVVITGAGGTAGGDSSSGGTNVAVSDLDRPAAGDKPDTQVKVTAPGQPQVTTTWTEDGEAMDGAADFRPGHVYTVTIRVKTNGAAFDSSVYTNAGYILERISDDELLLHRSFYVEETYTKDVTEEEAATIVENIQSQPEQPEGGSEPAQSDGEAPSQQEQPPAREKHGSTAVWIVLAILAAAALAVQFAVPGGWKRVFGKKANTTENIKNEGEGKQ